jgi:two-component system sensor histidine kinase AgrC
MWVITMKNPVAAPVQIVMDHIATTKDDKKLHGIGLINMENVAAKYNGMIKFANDNSEFIVRAGLKL